MTVVKEAFIEGRETDVSWEDSKARKQDLKLQVYANNMEAAAKRSSMEIIYLEKICPVSGEVLAVFNNRLAAARHICIDILNRPDKNPIAITGNLHMCMLAGWKAYGFYWKVTTKARYEDFNSVRKTGTPVFIKRKKECQVFPSIADAAAFLDIPRRTLSRYVQSGDIKVLEDRSIRRDGKPIYTYIQRYNPTKKTVGVGSQFSQRNRDAIRRLVGRRNRTIGDASHLEFNNYKIQVK